MILVTPARVKIAVSVAISSGNPRCARPPWPEYSPSLFSRTITQSRSPSPTPRRGETDAGQDACGPHVGVLIEALADAQAQTPQRDVVGQVRIADGAEINGVVMASGCRGRPRASCGRSGDSNRCPRGSRRRASSKSPQRFSRARRTERPAGMTSLPIPSPGMAAILCVLMRC